MLPCFFSASPRRRRRPDPRRQRPLPHRPRRLRNGRAFSVRSGTGCSTALPMRVPVDRKSTRLNSSHVRISYAVFCLKKKKKKKNKNNNKQETKERIQK